jgi:drug/metabolite transporter (DMT)-like permease
MTLKQIPVLILLFAGSFMICFSQPVDVEIMAIICGILYGIILPLPFIFATKNDNNQQEQEKEKDNENIINNHINNINEHHQNELQSKDDIIIKQKKEFGIIVDSLAYTFWYGLWTTIFFFPLVLFYLTTLSPLLVLELQILCISNFLSWFLAMYLSFKLGAEGYTTIDALLVPCTILTDYILHDIKLNTIGICGAILFVLMVILLQYLNVIQQEKQCKEMIEEKE